MFNMMNNMEMICKKNNIIPRGVIHIGAHEGQELNTYQKMGLKHILMIEANPEVYQRLKNKTRALPSVITVNCAITNHNGQGQLHVTSFDQSSSLFPLKHHRKIYPNIVETKTITVEAKTLDTLLQELKLSPKAFNLINIDIQGAELLAFKGAVNTLKHIEAINTEVNFEELYEGCALVEQIDHFLGIHGFKRIVTNRKYHPSWGDAVYIKKSAFK